MRKRADGERLPFIHPMKLKLFRDPPKGDDWIHEVKQDGYRTQIRPALLLRSGTLGLSNGSLS